MCQKTGVAKFAGTIPAWRTIAVPQAPMSALPATIDAFALFVAVKWPWSRRTEDLPADAPALSGQRDEVPVDAHDAAAAAAGRPEDRDRHQTPRIGVNAGHLTDRVDLLSQDHSVRDHRQMRLHFVPVQVGGDIDSTVPPTATPMSAEM